MNRYLIELPHEAGEVACARVIKSFLESGSEILQHADWGCHDGNHKSWVLVDGDTKQDALLVLPALFRHQAKVTALNKFTNADIEAMLGSAKN